MRLTLWLRRAGGVGAEVGSWQGDSAARFLRWARPAQLYLVDPWVHSDDRPHALYGGPGGQARMDDLYAGVLARFSRQIEEGRVVICRAHSLDAAAELPALDWAYIDGDHTYDGALADLEAYWPLLKPGGLLTGDDYRCVGWWEDGVTRAVKEFCQARSCQARIMGSQFLIKKPPE